MRKLLIVSEGILILQMRYREMCSQNFLHIRIDENKNILYKKDVKSSYDIRRFKNDNAKTKRNTRLVWG